MTYILGLDPGGTTGWSVWCYDAITPPRPVTHGQIPGGVKGFVDWWEGALCEFDWDQVVSESFVLDGRTAAPNVEPLRIEGALAVLWPETVFQRNSFKAHMTDQKIKDLGLWWKGQPHAIDSMRHVWAYLKVRQHMPTLMAGWPPPASR